jgi:hypothetical protein
MPPPRENMTLSSKPDTTPAPVKVAKRIKKVLGTLEHSTQSACSESHIGKTRRNALIMLGHKLNVRQKGQQLTQLIVVGEHERHEEDLPSARFTGFFTREKCHEGRVAVLAMRPHGLGSRKSQSILR